MSESKKARTESASPEVANDSVKGGSTPKTSFFSKIKEKQQQKQPETLTLDAWLDRCKTDKLAYGNVTDKLLATLGQPQVVDTKLSDAQERAVYGGEKITRFDAFKDFYDAERIVNQIVQYLQSGAKGMLVLRGPVGSGKTDIASRLEELAEEHPMYVLKCKVTGQISPFNDHPLCLVSDIEQGDKEALSAEYGIPVNYLVEKKSAWVAKRLAHHDGDMDAAFSIEKIYPSRDRQIGIAKLDPKDPKSADIGALIGEVDITKIGEEDPLDPNKTLSAGDPDAYIPGAFSKSNQGIFHGAEFFRNNPALMNTFLEGVTTGDFIGDKGVGRLPMNQIRIITTNDSVWRKFTSQNDSDAAKNRITVVNVPYSLRMSEEKKIYEKLMKKDRFANNPVAPKTLDIMAEFAIVSRIKEGQNGALQSYDKSVIARVLNGEIVDGPPEKTPKLRDVYQKMSPDQGMDGFSIRDADRVLSSTFNARANEGIYEADPILLIETLRKFIRGADESIISTADKQEYAGVVQKIAENYKKHLTEEINKAIIDADDAQCQNQFDRYLMLAQHWIDEEDYFDPETGDRTDFASIDAQLQAIEKKAGITQSASFRNNAVAGVNKELARIAKKNMGKSADQQEPVVVRWDSFEPLANVIRKQHASDIESKRSILKAKSDSDLKTTEEKRQYTRFNENMKQLGYTPTMVARALHHLNFT